VQIRLFGEVTDKDGRKRYSVSFNSSATMSKQKISYQFLPFLQKDILTKNIRVVEAQTLESTFVLPCTFPANADDCVHYIILPPQNTSDSIGWDECYFQLLRKSNTYCLSSNHTATISSSGAGSAIKTLSSPSTSSY
jgi:hypothetical protein